MAPPIKHAEIDGRKYNCDPLLFLPIHEFMDMSKSAFANSCHRAVFHHSFGSSFIIPRMFGPSILLPDGRTVPTKDIAEGHIKSDFSNRFIPTLQDYLEAMVPQAWMNGMPGAYPPSCRQLQKQAAAAKGKDPIIISLKD